MLGVNSFLWRASLDTISFMPLVSADPCGGVLITDWYTPPQTPNERFKINVYILGRAAGRRRACRRVYGAGLFAGPRGAVACTGHGEEIIRQATARDVYAAIAGGKPGRDAVEAAIRSFPSSSDIGIIALDASGWAVAGNRPMAFGLAGPDVLSKRRGK